MAIKTTPKECFMHAQAGRLNVRQNGPGMRTRFQLPAMLQGVTTNAAGKTDPAIVAMHHPPIPSRKNEQRHQVIRQGAIPQVDFECQQIRWFAIFEAWLLRAALTPGTVREDDHSRSHGFSFVLKRNHGGVTLAAPLHLGHCIGLIDFRTGAPGGF